MAEFPDAYCAHNADFNRRWTPTQLSDQPMD
jgi:hypothetical protein